MTEELEEISTETEEVEIAEEETVEDSVESEDDGSEPSASKEDGVQKRINQLTRKYREEQRQREAVEKANNELKSKFSELESKVEKIINPPPARPSREYFDSEEDYEDALIDWKIGQKGAAHKEEPKQKEPQKADEVPETVKENWKTQVKSAVTAYDDFIDVTFENPDLFVSDSMSKIIMESDKGAEVLYHLGKNPSEAERIAALSPIAQVREFVKLESKLVKKNPKSISNAPDPIKPVQGKDTPIKDPDKLPPEEWRKWREQQLSKKYGA